MSLYVEIPEVQEQLPSITTGKGLLLWISSVDHKQLGIMYLLVAFLFFLIGGVEAMIMRIQLTVPNNDFVSPEAYNQIFTMHGTTMIFLVLTPALIGLGTYLIPLMIGANEMAFPRLNAFSLWMTFFGGLLLYFSFITGGAPAAGWFNYAPLSESNYSVGLGVAHIHYVFLGGSLFGIFAGIYYWFPKITGRMLSARWGKWHFWLFIIGFNLTFFLQHFLGKLGMPRRVFTYPDLPWWAELNMLGTLGAVLMFAGICFFLWNLYVTLKKPRSVPANPWNAWTLEWLPSSPPPLKNFDELPSIHSRRPLWDMNHPDNPDKRLN